MALKRGQYQKSWDGASEISSYGNLFCPATWADQSVHTTAIEQRAQIRSLTNSEESKEGILQCNAEEL
jgi:hypothetical protein